MLQIITSQSLFQATYPYKERGFVDSIIDFRSIDRSFRHAIFFSMFEGLKEGASFEFMNDHDPVPLYNQLQSIGIENLEWSYSERGPDNWRIRITKTPPKDKVEEGCACHCGDPAQGDHE